MKRGLLSKTFILREDDSSKKDRLKMIKARHKAMGGEPSVSDDTFEDELGQEDELDVDDATMAAMKKIDSIVSIPWRKMIDDAFGTKGWHVNYIRELLDDGRSPNEIAIDVEILTNAIKKKNF